MQRTKIRLWEPSIIGILSGSSGLGRTYPRVHKRAITVDLARWKEHVMNRVRKIISFLGTFLFFLDFRKSFFTSCLKLFLVWNPLWTLIVTLIDNRTLASILFRWAWNFSEATIVCLLGLTVTRLFAIAEGAWLIRTGRTPPNHGTGWYLLFLAILAPPGLYVALRVIFMGINLFFAGAPISPTVQWPFYWKEILWLWALLLVCFLFIYWIVLLSAARWGKLRAQELEKERLQAVLTKLKDQMNPHFLFNALNTVASLIPADPAKAEDVVVKLSVLYQGVLAATGKTYHPLEKELEFCRDYLEIEKARFGPRLAWTIKVEQGLNPARALVPVLLLQPIVENAVKHGLSSRSSGGHILIRAQQKEKQLELDVEDDGVGFGNSPYAGSGTAMENCRKRLELDFGPAGRFEVMPREGGGTRILLTLPVLTSDTAETDLNAGNRGN